MPHGFWQYATHHFLIRYYNDNIIEAYFITTALMPHGSCFNIRYHYFFIIIKIYHNNDNILGTHFITTATMPMGSGNNTQTHAIITILLTTVTVLFSEERVSIIINTIT